MWVSNRCMQVVHRALLLSVACGLMSAYGCAVGGYIFFHQPKYQRALFSSRVPTDSIERLTKWTWPTVCVYSATVREHWAAGVPPRTPHSLDAARDRVVAAFGTSIDLNGTVTRARMTLADIQRCMARAEYQQSYSSVSISPVVVWIEHCRAGWPFHAVESWEYGGSWGGGWSFSEGAVRTRDTDPWSCRSIVPVHPVWNGLIADSAMHASVWFGLFVSAHFIRPRSRRRSNRCVACSYDIRGLASGSCCPECGAHNKADPTVRVL